MSQNKNNQDENLHISLATTYEIDDSFDSDKFIKMRLRVCHDGINPNKSAFEIEDMNKAENTIKNIPILAHVIFDENDNPQFGGHDMVLEQSRTDENEYKLIYKETPIGVVPESNNYEVSEFNGKNYVFVDCFVWKGYSNYAQDIIERDNDIKLSMEIKVLAYSYDAKSKIYNITDYKYTGITFLNKDFGTGMENALGTTGTFQEDSNKAKFIMIMEELNETLSNYNINITKEGGSQKLNEKLELLAKYNLTIENLDFKIDDFSLEELEAKLKEFTELKPESTPTFNFSATFIQKYNALDEALPQWGYEKDEAGNYIGEYYFRLNDFDEKFVYVTKVHWDRDGKRDLTSGRFSYSFDESTYKASIAEEFEPVFFMYLTAAEKQTIDDLRNNYELIKSQFDEYKETYKTPENEVETLRKYQSDVETQTRLEAENEIFSRFEKLNNIEDFETLKQNSKDYSLEELENRCFIILGKMTANFSNKTTKEPKNIKIPVSKTPQGDVLYGGLFDEFSSKTN